MTATTLQKSLTDRVAVVTGASSGIGAATARALAANGARVAVLARRADRIEALAAEIGGLAVVGDVTGDLTPAVDAIHDGLGRPDLVVANAGVMLAAPFETADRDEWAAMIDTNVRGLINTGRAFIDDLLAAAADGRPADLVHIGSIGGHDVFPTYAVYGATKAAVAHLTRNLRAELGPRGVRVRNVEPGLTDTELGDGMKDLDAREFLTDFRDKVGSIPPTDVADTIAWSAALPPRVNVAELIVLPTGQG
ncbi:MAG TPA: SDR family oxidoreductase [Jatrophihabitantaceae bacterium]|jgi:NADP-dependent 3-hydroxy acid dehydrogenase YdfG